MNLNTNPVKGVKTPSPRTAIVASLVILACWLIMWLTGHLNLLGGIVMLLVVPLPIAGFVLLTRPKPLKDPPAANADHPQAQVVVHAAVGDKPQRRLGRTRKPQTVETKPAEGEAKPGQPQVAPVQPAQPPKAKASASGNPDTQPIPVESMSDEERAEREEQLWAEKEAAEAEVARLRAAPDPLDGLQYIQPSRFSKRHIKWSMDEQEHVYFDERTPFILAIRLWFYPLACRGMNQNEKTAKPANWFTKLVVGAISIVFVICIMVAWIRFSTLRSSPGGFFAPENEGGRKFVLWVALWIAVWTVFVLTYLWPNCRYVLTKDYTHLIIQRLPFEPVKPLKMEMKFLASWEPNRTTMGYIWGYLHIDTLEFRQTKETIPRLLFAKQGYGFARPIVWLYNKYRARRGKEVRPRNNITDVLAAVLESNKLKNLRIEAAADIGRINQEFISLGRTRQA